MSANAALRLHRPICALVAGWNGCSIQARSLQGHGEAEASRRQSIREEISDENVFVKAASFLLEPGFTAQMPTSALETSTKVPRQ